MIYYSIIILSSFLIMAGAEPLNEERQFPTSQSSKKVVKLEMENKIVE